MTALTVGAGLPVWYANEVLVDAQEQKAKTPRSPNDRIVMGAIGTGTNRLRVQQQGRAARRTRRARHARCHASAGRAVYRRRRC